MDEWNLGNRTPQSERNTVHTLTIQALQRKWYIPIHVGCYNPHGVRTQHKRHRNARLGRLRKLFGHIELLIATGIG